MRRNCSSAAISAADAQALGMVSQVVPPAELDAASFTLAGCIATMPSLGRQLAKQAVNQSLDAQGQWTALQAASSLRQLGHSHNRGLHGTTVDPEGAARIRQLSAAPPVS